MATNNSVNSPLSGTTGTGNFVGSTSPAITTPSLGTLNDTSSQAMLQFIPSAGGSWITMENTSSPRIQSAGSGSNIGMYVKSKGDAPVGFVTQAVSSSTLQVYSGTASQHLTQFSFSNTSATRTVTFPDLTGTVALSGAGLMNVTFAQVTTPNTLFSQATSNTTFTGSTVLSNRYFTQNTSYNELAGFDFVDTGGSIPFARIAAYKTGSGSSIKIGTSNNYGSGITNTAVTINQNGSVTLSSALPVDSGGTGVTSTTAYAVLCGGTTSTGALQSVASVGTSNQLLASNGAGALPSFKTLNTLTTAPTIQTFTTGSGTYTTPAGVKYIVVEMVGGGGGGAGSGTSGQGNGSNGGNTTFGSATANGGDAGLPTGGAGGGASGGTINLAGGMGNFGGGTGVSGALGGSSYFAGGGAGGNNGGGAASNAPANTGAGGGGGGGSGTAQSSYAGGAGGYVRWVITSPAATYSYAVGSGGTGGVAGTAGGAGGNGAAGLIIVTEYYQ